MRNAAIGLLASLAFACVGDSSNNDGGTDATTDVSMDVAVDATADVAMNDASDAPVTCSQTAMFSTPQPISGFATSAWEAAPRLMPDELTMYFEGSGGALTSNINFQDLFVATRTKRTDAFGSPTALAMNSTTNTQLNPSVTSDGLTLFYTFWTGSPTEGRIWFVTRLNQIANFAGPAAVAGVATTEATSVDMQPFVTADGAELWFDSSRSGGQGGLDIYDAPQTGQSYSNPVNESSLNSGQDDWFATLSADRLTVYLASNRPGTGTMGGHDIYRAMRASTSATFPTPTLVPELNSPQDDMPGWLSSDNCRMYMTSTRITGDSYDLFMAERSP